MLTITAHVHMKRAHVHCERARVHCGSAHVHQRSAHEHFLCSKTSSTPSHVLTAYRYHNIRPIQQRHAITARNGKNININMKQLANIQK